MSMHPTSILATLDGTGRASEVLGWLIGAALVIIFVAGFGLFLAVLIRPRRCTDAIFLMANRQAARAQMARYSTVIDALAQTGWEVKAIEEPPGTPNSLWRRYVGGTDRPDRACLPSEENPQGTWALADRHWRDQILTALRCDEQYEACACMDADEFDRILHRICWPPVR